MKLHTYVRKLFDNENRYLQREKRLAKENEHKARAATPENIMPSRRNYVWGRFGFIWWRNRQKRGAKNAQGQMLPMNQTSVQE